MHVTKSDEGNFKHSDSRSSVVFAIYFLYFVVLSLVSSLFQTNLLTLFLVTAYFYTRPWIFIFCLFSDTLERLSGLKNTRPAGNGTSAAAKSPSNTLPASHQKTNVLPDSTQNTASTCSVNSATHLTDSQRNSGLPDTTVLPGGFLTGIAVVATKNIGRIRYS